MGIKFCSPMVPDFDKVVDGLKDSLASGQLSNFGPIYESLCSRLNTEYSNLGVHSVVVSSGHTALMAAYAVLGIKRLVVPAYTFESTRVAATLQGIEVIVVDVDPETLSITPEILSTIPDSDYDGVVAVCPISVVPDLCAVQDYCAAKGKKLIIDGAATYGTELNCVGDALCLSFHATKTLSVGEGGAVLFTNAEDAKRARQYINFGFDSNRRPVMPGMNAKISEYSCAIAAVLMDNIEPLIELKKWYAELYNSLIGKYIPPFEVGTIFQCLPIYAPTEEKALELRKELAVLGIEARQYYYPLEPLPVALDAYNRNVCLPIHQDMSPEDVEAICLVVNKVLNV
jgi:dTDP-4-amino-4,6-dideoxygalactose transaminase